MTILCLESGNLILESLYLSFKLVAGGKIVLTLKVSLLVKTKEKKEKFTIPE